MVITFKDVSFEYSEKTILDKASFSITDNEKIGVVGINGVGKTTLIKLIIGSEIPLEGEIIKSGGIIINYLKQEQEFDENKTILEYVMEASSIEHPIDEFEAKSILSKMGFDDYLMHPINLSGGEKKRLALSKVLVSYSDLLILDEPTNHLDPEIILWLEKFLIKYKKSVLLVTHDRYFLERICKKMLEIDCGKTYMYDANYNLFLERKAERIEREKSEKRKLVNLLRRESEWIHRGAEARSTKQKARIDRYNELKETKFNNRDQQMKFDSVSTRLGKKLIEIKNGSKYYGDLKLFSGFSFNLNRHDIIGIVGKNGAGKSTLLKIINGNETLTDGELIKGETLRIGYFSQHLELINPEIRILDYINESKEVISTNDGLITSEQLLEKFLFNRSVQQMKVKTLSGGEKRRLQLVKILADNPNVLLLDEPTNDLDIYTLGILEDYILDFDGPILVISHDRYFLDKVCNKLFIINDERIIESNKTFSEYLESSSKETKDTKEDRLLKYQEQDRIKKEQSSYKKEYNKLSLEIEELDKKIKELKDLLSKETNDYLKMMDLQKDIDELTISQEKKLERQFELEELIID